MADDKKIIFSMVGVSKAFQANKQVLKDIYLSFFYGAKIGIIGLNGSGKSTILKSLIRQLALIGGTVYLDGKSLQTLPERDLARTMSVLLTEHVRPELMTCWDVAAAGRYPYTGRLGLLSDEDRAKVDEALALVGADELADRDFSCISDGQRQRVLLARAICQEPEILILDEPTASLNEDDSQALLELLLKFKKQGMTSIIISHKLNEISYVADKITVIRDGSTIETLDKKKDDFSEQRIIQGMVGREMTDRFPKRPDVKIGDVSMEVKNWNVYHPLYSERKVVDNVSFKVHKGEVVGISGLMGAGRTEFAKSLFGHSYGTKIHGEVKINGKVVHLNNVRQAIEAGLAYVTEDRKGDGLVLENPISTNMTLANLEAVSDHMVIDKDLELAKAKELKQDLNVKCASVLQNVGNLSGGNQQKVLLAKWMFAEPDVLILDEPTRGIDVGAKYEIYCLINKLVEAGKAVLMISSELPEVLGMSDRIYVMNEGKIVGEMPRSEASQESIMSAILRTSGKKKSVEQ